MPIGCKQKLIKTSLLRWTRVTRYIYKSSQPTLVKIMENLGKCSTSKRGNRTLLHRGHEFWFLLCVHNYTNCMILMFLFDFIIYMPYVFCVHNYTNCMILMFWFDFIIYMRYVFCRNECNFLVNPKCLICVHILFNNKSSRLGTSLYVDRKKLLLTFFRVYSL